MTTNPSVSKRLAPRQALARRGAAVPGTNNFYAAVRDELVEFARPAYQPTAGFAWLDTDGTQLAGRPQFLYVTCRMTYVACLEVVRSGIGSGLDWDRAVHGIGLLATYFKDHEHGGWFTALAPSSTQDNVVVVDDRKAAYPHTFVVLAAATAKAAGIPGASHLLADALAVLESRFWDDHTGMFVEDYSRDFNVLDTYRGANSNMHGVEALLAAHSATGDIKYLEMAARICRRIIGVAQEFSWRLPEHFDQDWQVLPQYNADTPFDPVRPFGSTPGHWLEWARLLLHVMRGQEAAGFSPDLSFLDAAVAFFDQAFADAWGTQGGDGLLFTVDFSGRPLSDSRLHWVTCEGIGAARALFEVTGQDRFAIAERQLWKFAAEHFFDADLGSWHHELDGQNRPAQTIRVGKADIYHAYQAAVLATVPLRITIIDALIEERTTMPQTRLSLATLAQAQRAQSQVSGAQQIPVVGPEVDPKNTTVGIVHLGIGAFHRAHQAVYTELAAAKAGETHWGIMGVTQRSRSVIDQLAPQDGLYCVLEKGTANTEIRIMGSTRDVAFPGEDTQKIITTIAAPTTHIVSLTVTEKGYRASADGHLDLSDADVTSDLAAARAGDTSVPARSPIGLLIRGLLVRAKAALTDQSAGPLTVMCCDNMVDNGTVVEGLVKEFLGAVGEQTDLAAEIAWLDQNVTFPSTMVDRIVPATTEDHRAQAQAILGVRDEGLVVAEPFMQWVIEDKFAGPRPAWEMVGATLTSEVAPFEQAKLRMLNATHSLLAYFGALKDVPLIADAVNDAELEQVAKTLLFDDVIPTLEIPDGMELEPYALSILERFANPNTGHTTIQVAMDGSKKLPFRLFGTVSDRLAAGAVPHGAAWAVAAWITFIYKGQTFGGNELVLDDPRAAELQAAVRSASKASEMVAALVALPDLFPADIAGHDGFKEAVTEKVADLLAR